MVCMDQAYRDALRAGVGALNVWLSSTPRDVSDFGRYLQDLIHDEGPDAELQVAVGMTIAADLLLDLVTTGTDTTSHEILSKIVQAAEESADG